MKVQNRSMVDELHIGTSDNSVIVVAPNRAEIENYPIERLSWPYYAGVMVPRDPFAESHMQGPVRTAPRAFNRLGWR